MDMKYLAGMVETVEVATAARGGKVPDWFTQLLGEHGHAIGLERVPNEGWLVRGSKRKPLYFIADKDAQFHVWTYPEFVEAVADPNHPVLQYVRRTLK